VPTTDPGRCLAAGTALAAATLLTGCQAPPFSQIAGIRSGAEAAATAPPRPTARPGPLAPSRLVTDQLSADLATYYARIESDRLARGLLRTDDGTRDTPISAGRLVQVWSEIAMRDEHLGSSLSQPGGPAPLRRWEQPVVYRMEFGASVPSVVQEADRVEVARLVARMATATSHPLRLAPAGATTGNFHVLVLSETERRAIGPRLRALVPGIDDATVRLITDLPREAFCLAVAFARGGGAVYTDAVAIIRAEHPDLTRLSCYHEELAQGLGLAADSPRARPSLFNDNKEFALLTALDLLMLRLHYDPRLRPGWTEREARPIAFAIASELAAGES